jgi:RimJ/RimL family protein N-acetyltransferase
MKHILETPRLALREMSFDDLDFIATMLAHPEVMRYYPKCYSREEAAAWVQRRLDHYARCGHSLWLASNKVTGDPVGQVGMSPVQVDGVEEAEIGYMIHRPFWRQGFASEAGAGTRDYAFQTLGKKRVISLIRPENLPSQGVATKIGMRPELRMVQHGGFPHLVFALESGQ